MALLRKIDQYTSGNSQVKYLKFFKEICTMIHLLLKVQFICMMKSPCQSVFPVMDPYQLSSILLFPRMLPTAAFGNSCTWKMEYMHLLHVFWLIFLDVQGSYQCFCYDRGYSKVSLQTQNFIFSTHTFRQGAQDFFA